MPPKASKKDAPEKSGAYSFAAEYGPDGNKLVKGAESGRNRAVIPSGVLALDLATGYGGFPLGSICTITGEPGVGKSTTMFRLSANAQARGMYVFYVDAENRWSPEIAEANGLDLEENVPFADRHFFLSQWRPYIPGDPEYTEAQAHGTLQGIMKAIRKFYEDPNVMKNGGIVIFDSINAVIPDQQEPGATDAKGKAKDPGDGGGLGLIARLMSNWLPELSAIVASQKGLCIFTRQIRSKIGVMAFGNNYSGGNALRHYSSLDLDMDSIGKIQPSEAEKTEGWERKGTRIKIVTKKNTRGVSGRRTEFTMSSASGPDDLGMILEYGVMFGVVKKAGAYWKYIDPTTGELSAGRYKEDLLEFFWSSEENLIVMYKLMAMIREKGMIKPMLRSVIAAVEAVKAEEVIAPEVIEEVVEDVDDTD